VLGAEGFGFEAGFFHATHLFGRDRCGGRSWRSRRRCGSFGAGHCR
jgi:hypothetical protein